MKNIFSSLVILASGGGFVAAGNLNHSTVPTPAAPVVVAAPPVVCVNGVCGVSQGSYTVPQLCSQKPYTVQGSTCVGGSCGPQSYSVPQGVQGTCATGNCGGVSAGQSSYGVGASSGSCGGATRTGWYPGKFIGRLRGR